MLVPAITILMHSGGQREPSVPAAAHTGKTATPKKQILGSNSSDGPLQASPDERKRIYEGRKQEQVLAARRFAQKSTPESIRRSISNGLKSKEKRYRNLMNSLGISEQDAGTVLTIILERNITCYSISIDANTESDPLKKEFLRSGQGPVKAQARQDMIKVVGEENVREIQRLEQQILDEVAQTGPSSLRD